jgi:hypothetical protein
LGFRGSLASLLACFVSWHDRAGTDRSVSGVALSASDSLLCNGINFGSFAGHSSASTLPTKIALDAPEKTIWFLRL